MATPQPALLLSFCLPELTQEVGNGWVQCGALHVAWLSRVQAVTQGRACACLLQLKTYNHTEQRAQAEHHGWVSVTHQKSIQLLQLSYSPQRDSTLKWDGQKTCFLPLLGSRASFASSMGTGVHST